LQRYFCKKCRRSFYSKRRINKLCDSSLWQQYVQGKQTQKQISEKLGKSREWVNKKLAKCESLSKGINTKLIPRATVIIIDTTYLEQFGLMVFRSANLKENLLWYKVSHETNDLYRKGIEELIALGWIIKAIVADGKPGLSKLFPQIPFQLCQFHQFAVVTRYISKKPKLIASIELRQLMFLLKETDEASFTYWLNEWHKKWGDFLNEKTINSITEKSSYTHKRLRSAHRSIRRNLIFLFTFERNIPTLYIPTTTNSLDGYFSHLKSKLSVHRGASKQTQLKIIQRLIF